MTLVGPGLGYGAAEMPERQNINPTLGKLLMAQLNTENSIGLALNSVSEHWEPLRQLFYGDIDPRLKETEFNINSLNDTHYAPYAKDFLNVKTEAEALAKKQRIDKEIEYRQIIASGSIGQNLITSLAAGLLDPVSWISMGSLSLPGFAAKYAGKAITGQAAKTALIAGAGAAQQTLATEAIAQGLSYTRTIEESALNIGSSALLGGLIGGGASKATTTMRSYWRNKAAGAFDKDLADIATGDLLTGQPAPRVPQQQVSQTIGEQKKMIGDYPGWRSASAEKALKWFGKITPSNRLVFSPSENVHNAVRKLVTLGYNIDSDLNYQAAPYTAHVAATRTKMVARDQLGSILLETQKKLRAAGYQYSKDRLSQEMYETYTRGTASSGTQITFDHPISIINESLSKIFSEIAEPLKNKAIETGVFTPNIRTKYASQYLPRVWDKDAIRKNRTYFEELMMRGYQGERESLIEKQRILEEKIATKTRKVEEGIKHKIPEYASPAEEKAALQQRLILESEEKQRRSEIIQRNQDIIDNLKEEVQKLEKRHTRANEQLDLVRIRQERLKERMGKLKDKESQINDQILQVKKDTSIEPGDKTHKLNELNAEKERIKNRSNTYRLREAMLKGREKKRQEITDKLSKRLETLGPEIKTRQEALEQAVKRVTQQEQEATQKLFSKGGKLHESLEKDKTRLEKLKQRIQTDDEIKSSIREVLDNMMYGINGNIEHPVSRKDRHRRIPIENTDALPFLVTDFEVACNMMIERVSTDAALQERFGAHVSFFDTDDYKKIVEEFNAMRQANPQDSEKLGREFFKNVNDLVAIWDLMRGKFGKTTHTTADDWFKRGVRLARGYGVVTKLGAMAFSSIADLAMGVHHVGIKRFMGTALTGLMRTEGWNLAREEAKALGFIFDVTLNNTLPRDLLSLTEQANMTALPEKMLKRGQNFVVKWSGASWLETIKSRLNTMLVQQDILKTSQAIVDGTANHSQRAFLASIGIDAEIAAQFVNSQKKFGSTKSNYLLGGFDKWDKGLRDQFINSLSTGVEKLSLNPQAWEKPLFLSTMAGSLIGQWMGWAFTAYDKIVVAGLQRGDANTLMGILTSVGLATISEKLREIWTGTREDRRLQNDQILSNAIVRSGITGHMGVMLERISAISGGMPAYYLAGRTVDNTRVASAERAAIQILGPTAGMLVDALSAGTLLFKEGRNAKNVRSLTKLMPFRNLMPFRIMWDEAEMGLMNAMGIEQPVVP